MENLDTKTEQTATNLIIQILIQIRDNHKELNARIEQLSMQKKGPSLQEIITIDQLQKILEISSNTASRHIRDGILPKRKIGGRHFFYEQDIHDALSKRDKDEPEDE